MKEIKRELAKLDQELAGMTQEQRVSYLRSLGFDVVPLDEKKRTRDIRPTISTPALALASRDLASRVVGRHIFRYSESKPISRKG